MQVKMLQIIIYQKFKIFKRVPKAIILTISRQNVYKRDFIPISRG